MLDPAILGCEDLSPGQRQAVQAVLDHGSPNAAAKALGVGRTTINQHIDRAKKKAARYGIAPGHFEHGTAPGYLMGKVTVQRGPQGDVERVWERQSPDSPQRLEAMQVVIEGLCERLPTLPRIEPPALADEDLLTKYIITDYHVGAYAWAEETGADWDLAIAEKLLKDCFRDLVARSPSSGTALIAQLGDFLDYDGMLPVTPTSRHILDVDGRFAKVVDVAIDCIIGMVTTALEKHDKVVLLCAEGNHDESSSVWLRSMFRRLYADNHRVHVITQQQPFYVHEFGANMFTFHHGHKVRKEQIPLLFAARYPEMWGRTKYRTCDMGHYHHLDARDHSGMRVIQHPTLAAANAHSARGGYDAPREATASTYHRQYGWRSTVTVTPEAV